MTSVIEVAYTSQQGCNNSNHDHNLGTIINVRNMTIGIGCGCIPNRRNRNIRLDSLFSDDDYVLT